MNLLRNSENRVHRRMMEFGHVLTAWSRIPFDPTETQSQSHCLKCGKRFTADALGERESDPNERCKP